MLAIARRPHYAVVLDALICANAFFIVVTLGTSTVPVRAQGVGTAIELAPSTGISPDAGAAPTPAGAMRTSANPRWQDLTPAQQLSLKPLAAHWNAMGETRKRKWIAIAAGYARLSPEGQSELHSRMTEWASLNQQQRNQARLNFAKSKQLSSRQKTATWDAYQALSPEEKKKLATSRPPKPSGVAATIIPVAPKKLATVTLPQVPSSPMTKPSAPNPALNPKTLLPRAPKPVAAASALKP